ncbi:hypothetical protein QAD02_008338 [Eretmocerus hayati]|uniref:Uncharacterized protein n=1 Tax=Eretmocerus hayati TaxID=131215 RepID=A0ACC2N714_9HYME|nr:hypothetical protein QAD02_008338 [Eretmocerus hayati]
MMPMDVDVEDHEQQTSFFIAFDISREKEDGPTIARYTEQAIQYAKDRLNTDVVAVISDNDSKIKRGVSLARNADSEALISVTYSSHSCNLLIKSPIPKTLVTNSRTVANAFSEPKAIARIRRLRGTMIKNYPDTRFCYIIRLFLSIVTNLHILRQICEDENVGISDEVKQLLQSEDFVRKITVCTMLLEPLSNLIIRCQDPEVTQAEAVQMWLNLHFGGPNLQALLIDRMRRALPDAAFAAYLLHPGIRRDLLDDVQQQRVIDYILAHLNPDDNEQLEVEIRRELKGYLNIRPADDDDDRDGAQRVAELAESELLQSRDIPAELYWDLTGGMLLNIARLAKKLILLPSGTGLIESFLSHWAYVHDIYKNRLGHDRSCQLVDCQYTLTKRTTVN